MSGELLRMNGTHIINFLELLGAALGQDSQGYVHRMRVDEEYLTKVARHVMEIDKETAGAQYLVPIYRSMTTWEVAEWIMKDHGHFQMLKPDIIESFQPRPPESIPGKVIENKELYLVYPRRNFGSIEEIHAELRRRGLKAAEVHDAFCFVHRFTGHGPVCPLEKSVIVLGGQSEWRFEHEGDGQKSRYFLSFGRAIAGCPQASLLKRDFYETSAYKQAGYLAEKLPS